MRIRTRALPIMLPWQMLLLLAAERRTELGGTYIIVQVHLWQRKQAHDMDLGQSCVNDRTLPLNCLLTSAVMVL